MSILELERTIVSAYINNNMSRIQLTHYIENLFLQKINKNLLLIN